MRGTPPAISFEGLSKSFAGTAVFTNASLAVRPGEFVAVLGPSGAGKSTLFRCLVRLTEPDGGTIAFNGKPYHGLRGRALAAARRNIGIVFQQHNLVRQRSALENVLAGRLARTPLWRVAARKFLKSDCLLAAEALDRVGLMSRWHQRADTLSGGQQQRVAIARALAQGSRVILADEPVASLDPLSADRVLSVLRQLADQEGIAILCSLHQPNLAQQYADRIVTISGGRMSETGSDCALFAMPEPESITGPIFPGARTGSAALSFAASQKP